MKALRWLVPAGAAVLLLMTFGAFGEYFFGENFIYLRQFHEHGDHFFRALFSPSDGIFFRPLFFAVTLPWHFVLPQEPWAFHLRNFAFSVVNLWLFHRLLLHLVTSRGAHVIAFFFFAISKVHLTTIGYINIFDSIVMLMLLLAALLFFSRNNYAFGYAFAILSMFTKDHGVVIVAVVMALIGIRRSWPLVIAAAGALALRFAIAGGLPISNPTYAPVLSLDVLKRKLAIFTSTIGNISFYDNGITGAASTSLWIAIALYLGLIGLLLATLIAGWSERKRWLFPLVWIAVYLGPTLLNRNFQIYYNYEALAGVAVLIALCLDRAKRLQWVWAAALVVIFANGIVSNYTSNYYWQQSARAAESLKAPLTDRYRGRAPRRIVFATASRRFWEFTLEAPLLQELLEAPRLDVLFIDPNDLPLWRGRDLVVDLDRRTVYAQSADPTR